MSISAVRSAIFGRASEGHMYGISYSLNKTIEFIELSDYTMIYIKSSNIYVAPVYLNFNQWNRDIKDLCSIILENNNMNVLLMGDFNRRMGSKQKISKYWITQNLNRNSKDQLEVKRAFRCWIS